MAHKKEILTFKTLLENNCWNAEDWKAYEKYGKEKKENETYQGVRISEIRLHCVMYVIRWQITTSNVDDQDVDVYRILDHRIESH